MNYDMYEWKKEHVQDIIPDTRKIINISGADFFRFRSQSPDQKYTSQDKVYNTLFAPNFTETSKLALTP